jgi:hypothetical protein
MSLIGGRYEPRRRTEIRSRSRQENLRHHERRLDSFQSINAENGTKLSTLRGAVSDAKRALSRIESDLDFAERNEGLRD